MADYKALEDLVVQVRRDILRQVHKVNSGHPGGSLGCAEFFVALYNELMERNEDFTWMELGKTFSSFQTDIFLQFFIVFWHELDIFRLKN